MNDPLAWVDGHLVPQSRATVSVLDRGFLYGDAAFETLAVQGGRVFRLEAHLERLAASMRALHFAAPPAAADVGEAVCRLVAANGVDRGIVRVAVSRGVGPRGLDVRAATRPTVVATLHPVPPVLEALHETGASAVLANVRRVPPACLPAAAKHANQLNSILAHVEATAAGAYEALMTTLDGHLAEGSFSNVFFVDRGRLHTPDVSLGILPGITRAAVLDLARSLGMTTTEGRFRVDDLLAADEAFLTSTAAGVLPLSHVGPRRWPASGPVTQCLRAAYRRLVERS